MGKIILKKMKFISIFALIICASIFASAISSPAKATTHYTNFQESNGGEIFYLDRHAPLCKGGAISSFRLQRQGGDEMRYMYSCIHSEAIGGQTIHKQTNFGAGGGNYKEPNYLDKHNIECPAGTVLKYFRQGRDGNNINYKYQCVKANILCCKNLATVENEMGDQIFYIDRHHPGAWMSKSYAMQRVKLDSGYSPNRVIKYSYRMCKLRDMDAARAVEQNKYNLQTQQNDLQAASDKLEQSTQNIQQIQKQLAEITAKLNTAQEILNADQQAVEALHTSVQEAQNLLTTSEADPGLRCDAR